MQWTPAHGRRPDWRPILGNADQLRQVNHAADTAAIQVLQAELQTIQEWLTAKQCAEDWADKPLQWARNVAIMWDSHVASAADAA